MKKSFRHITLMSTPSQKESLTTAMQEAGIFHLEVRSKEHTGDDDLKANIRLLKQSIELIKDYAPASGIDTSDPLALAQRTKELVALRDKARQKHEHLLKKREYLLQWGDFDRTKFDALIERGLYAYLGQATEEVWENLNFKEMYHTVVGREGKTVFFVVLNDEEPLIGTDIIPLPGRSPSVLLEEASELEKQIKQYEQELSFIAYHLPLMESTLYKLQDDYDLEMVKDNFTSLAEDQIMTITGWYPADRAQDVEQFLQQNRPASLIRDPRPGEDIPVQLDNPFYIRLFEPITRIFELPNYHELDLTPLIAVFYPILFAYCLGDAGYGFLMLAGSVAGAYTFLREQRSVAVLGMVLGAVTLVMGLIKSGSLFGITLIPESSSPLIQYLSGFVIIKDDSDFIFNAFNVALMIGVLQIITGNLISIYNHGKYKGWQHMLFPTGKLLIISSLIWIFLADMQKLEALQVGGILRQGMLYTGLALVIFFHQLGVPVYKRAVNAFMPLFFIFTGILGDILSYVRLFALGLASSILGLVVNQIGGQIMEGGILSLVLGIVFLIFGHSLNLAIAALGSFVHPLRLTFVEFYSNVGFTGKGIEYKPFSKTIKQ